MARSLNVAVVDDDVAILDAIKMVLEEQGWRVAIYTDGNQFLNNLNQDSFDCVVLDPHLPDIKGVEIVRYIENSTIDLPVVVLTARPYSPQTIELKGTRVHDILTKPVSDIVLIESIKSSVCSSTCLS